MLHEERKGKSQPEQTTAAQRFQTRARHYERVEMPERAIEIIGSLFMRPAGQQADSDS